MRCRCRNEGSLAAYIGLPAPLIYCASKAALRAYGEALRAWLAPQSVGVSVVLPRYVDTSMADSLSGPKPAVLSPASVAEHIMGMLGFGMRYTARRRAGVCRADIAPGNEGRLQYRVLRGRRPDLGALTRAQMSRH